MRLKKTIALILMLCILSACGFTLVACSQGDSTGDTDIPDYGPAQLYGMIGDTNVRYSQDTYADVLSGDKTSESLIAWKGDKALSQIALASKGAPIKNVAVSVSDFVSGENKIDASQIDISFIDETLAHTEFLGYGKGKGPSDTPKGTKDKVSVPDVISGATVADIPHKSVKGVWVEIYVPKSTPAATYTGKVTVSWDEVKNIVFDYTLEVLDITLPDATDFDFDMELWQYPYSIAEYYGVAPFSAEHIAILKTHMAQYRDMGGKAITCTIVDEAWDGQTYSKNDIRYPSMVKWIKGKDGSFHYDYSDFDAWVTLNKELGIGNNKIVLYSIATWAGRIRYLNEKTGKYVTITPTVGSANWTTMWVDFLEKMIAHLEEKGWFDETYMGIDEAGFSIIRFNLIESVKGTNGKPLKTAGAFDSIADATKVRLSDRIDDLSVSTSAVKEHPAEYARLVASRDAVGKKTTIYTSMGQFPNNFTLSLPGESYWIAFFCASQNADGYLRWAYDAWVEDPLNDTTHWGFEAGDCFQVYPGDETNGYTTRMSLRMAKLAEGIRDINKLKYLEKMMPSLADEIAALYAKVRVDYSYFTNKGAMYADSTSKAQIPIDMAELKKGVNDITKKYLGL